MKNKQTVYPILCYGLDYNNNEINIIANIIDICNYSCDYCCNTFKRCGQQLDINALSSFIQNIINKTTYYINLTLVGGEPTLHPELINFCCKISAFNKIHIEILTNLSNSLDYYINLLKTGIKISASWHGGQDKHNIMFAKKLFKLPDYFYKNKQIEIRIMLEHDNWQNSIFIFNLLKHHFLQNIEISLLLDKCGKLYKYSNNQLKTYFDIIKTLPYTNNTLVIKYNDMTEKHIIYNGIYLNKNLTSFKSWKCNAGVNHLYIHVNGNVFNCERYYEMDKKPICNIIEFNGKYDKSIYQPCICCSDYCTCDLTLYKQVQI